MFAGDLLREIFRVLADVLLLAGHFAETVDSLFAGLDGVVDHIFLLPDQPLEFANLCIEIGERFVFVGDAVAVEELPALFLEDFLDPVLPLQELANFLLRLVFVFFGEQEFDQFAKVDDDLFLLVVGGIEFVGIEQFCDLLHPRPDLQSLGLDRRVFQTLRLVRLCFFQFLREIRHFRFEPLQQADDALLPNAERF